MHIYSFFISWEGIVPFRFRGVVGEVIGLGMVTGETTVEWRLWGNARAMVWETPDRWWRWRGCRTR